VNAAEAAVRHHQHVVSGPHVRDHGANELVELVDGSRPRAERSDRMRFSIVSM